MLVVILGEGRLQQSLQHSGTQGAWPGSHGLNPCISLHLRHTGIHKQKCQFSHFAQFSWTYRLIPLRHWEGRAPKENYGNVFFLFCLKMTISLQCGRCIWRPDGSSCRRKSLISCSPSFRRHGSLGRTCTSRTPHC